MFETILAQQLNKELLGKIRVSGSGTLFNEQSGTARRPDQRVMRDDAMQVGPQTVYVRGAKAVDPLRSPRLPVVAALPGRWRFSTVPESASFSGSSLMDFTGLSVLAPIVLIVRRCESAGAER